MRATLIHCFSARRADTELASISHRRSVACRDKAESEWRYLRGSFFKVGQMIENEGVVCERQHSCILCGSEGRPFHDGLVDREFGAPGVWAQRRCSDRSCGLVWLDPMPKAAEIGQFYQNYWTHDTAAADRISSALPSLDSSPKVKLVKELLARLLFWRADALRSDRYHFQGVRPGRLLDIGCGNGDFIGFMATVGWQAHGIDFDPGAIAAASRHCGVTTSLGDIFEQGFGEGAFDAILMSNVIEHLPNPQQTLNECFRVLAPGGRMVVLTPNVESWGHKLFGPDWRGLEPPRHLYLFSPKSLRKMAINAGFTQARTFTTPGGHASTSYMIERSARNAELAGRPVPQVRIRTLAVRERVLDILGQPSGEWVTLVVQR